MRTNKTNCHIRKTVKLFFPLIVLLVCIAIVAATGCGDESVRDLAYKDEASPAVTTMATQEGSATKPSSTESPFGMHPASNAGGPQARTGESFAKASDILHQ